MRLYYRISVCCSVISQRTDHQKTHLHPAKTEGSHMWSPTWNVWKPVQIRGRVEERAMFSHRGYKKTQLWGTGSISKCYVLEFENKTKYTFGAYRLKKQLTLLGIKRNKVGRRPRKSYLKTEPAVKDDRERIYQDTERWKCIKMNSESTNVEIKGKENLCKKKVRSFVKILNCSS